jgi:DNA-binding transcriptional MerR regulator
MPERSGNGRGGRPASGELIRIGELSRRVGVSVHSLRAWERRYGVPTPARTSGGFRLYSAADEERLRAMCLLITEGASPGQAALAVTGDDGPRTAPPEPGAIPAAVALTEALERFDDDAAQRLLDDVFATRTQDTVIRDVLLPCLRSIGERWAAGRVSIAQEHFATTLLRGRLLGLTRGWSCGTGPRALLACPPGEQHDLGLLCFGLTLRSKGWRITFLGADTPLSTTLETAAALAPDLVVIAATLPEHLSALGPSLEASDATAPLALAGPGATQELAQRARATCLPGDPVDAATAAAALR